MHPIREPQQGYHLLYFRSGRLPSTRVKHDRVEGFPEPVVFVPDGAHGSREPFALKAPLERVVWQTAQLDAGRQEIPGIPSFL